MKYLLIMQLIFDGYKAGGATVETVILENLNDCEKAKSTFMTEMKETRPYGAQIFRKAECVKISGSY